MALINGYLFLQTKIIKKEEYKLIKIFNIWEKRSWKKSKYPHKNIKYTLLNCRKYNQSPAND